MNKFIYRASGVLVGLIIFFNAPNAFATAAPVTSESVVLEEIVK